jgi:UDP-GlcNAc:undecaprenyl-phosphate/decaprenyl-phosphate GlcNAc-1-phosphate transferase
MLAIIFFSLGLIGLMNGINFIDGMNGLAVLTIMGALSSCIALSYIAKDNQAFIVLVPWLIMLSIFLLFNYPFGKIFLGDSGAYFIGILLGIWLIDFFARHNQISSWNALLIIFYPSIEVIYSVIRKISQGKSPFYPDREHLHIKIFDIVYLATKKPLYANNVTTIFLAIFWLAPALMVQFLYSSQLAIAICLVFLTTCYILINLFTPTLKKNQGKPKKT